jgi:hypothetical protein
VPSSALVAPPDAWGLGDTVDIVIGPGESRTLPVPLAPATELRIASWLSDAVDVAQGATVAEARVRLATGREIAMPLRAGLETSEWAIDREDVRGVVRHERAPVLESFRVPDATFLAHRYLGILRLPSRLFVDSVRIVRGPGTGRLTIGRLALVDGVAGRYTPLSLASAFVSDESQLHELASTPSVRLFAVTASRGRAFVVEALRVLPSDSAVMEALHSPDLVPVDLQRVALATEADARGVALPADGRSSRAAVVTAGGSHLEVRAQGPGILVVCESFDRGWRATVDDRPAVPLRVNGASMGFVLGPGTHRVLLRHRPDGFAAGLALAAAGALVAGVVLTRRV